jgi:hypothetical protein
MKHHEVEPKVGGFLLVSSRWNKSLSKIDKITKFHIVSGDYKYRIGDGIQIGADKWSLVMATAISDEKAAQLRREWKIMKEEREMRDKITELVKTAEHAKLTQILQILNEGGEK